MASGAVQIKARDVVEDLRAGLADDALMSKYQISARQLQRLFQKLVDGGFIEQSELTARFKYLARQKPKSEDQDFILVEPYSGKARPVGEANSSADQGTPENLFSVHAEEFSCQRCGKKLEGNSVHGTGICNECASRGALGGNDSKEPSQDIKLGSPGLSTKKEGAGGFSCSVCGIRTGMHLVEGARYCDLHRPSSPKAIQSDFQTESQQNHQTGDTIQEQRTPTATGGKAGFWFDRDWFRGKAVFGTFTKFDCVLFLVFGICCASIHLYYIAVLDRWVTVGKLVAAWGLATVTFVPLLYYGLGQWFTRTGAVIFLAVIGFGFYSFAQHYQKPQTGVSVMKETDSRGGQVGENYPLQRVDDCESRAQRAYKDCYDVRAFPYTDRGVVPSEKHHQEFMAKCYARYSETLRQCQRFGH